MTSVSKIKSPISSSSTSEDDADLRRGPWTLEEDTLLIHYIARHSEGRWNLLAKRAGLRRTGKSCRLRWLNYLKPDVKRGNLSPQEQLLILDLHSKWGNRWSKIAQHLPGRTDNEIKNYWRTRVQKQARHLKIDANSTTFQDLIRCFWIPRLLQKIEGSTPSPTVLSENQIISQPAINFAPQIPTLPPQLPQKEVPDQAPIDLSAKLQGFEHHEQNSDSEHCTSSCISSAESMNNNISLVSHQFSGYPTSPFHGLGSNNIDYSNFVKDYYYVDSSCYDIEAMNLGNMSGPGGFATNPAGDHHVVAESNWGFGSDLGDGMWNMDELWQFRNLQQRET